MNPSRRVPAADQGQGLTGTDEVFEALAELFAIMREGLRGVMDQFDLPPPYALALARIDDTVSMKELGAELRCDPSFVTAIADVLEDRGLARREVDRADRRIKNLVLTRRGMSVRSKLKREFFEDLPGVRKLDPDERRRFVELLRKMVSVETEAGRAGHTRPRKA